MSEFSHLKNKLLAELRSTIKNSRSGCARSGCFLRLRDPVTEKRAADGVY